MVLSQTFSTREEGIREIMHLSPTLGGLFYAYICPSYQTFCDILTKYVNGQPHPRKAREPFEEGGVMRFALTPGHLRFKSSEICVEIVPEKDNWKFTIVSRETDGPMTQERNQKRAEIMGWEEIEEFPENDEE